MQYILNDGRIWDTNQACFIEATTEDPENIITLFANGKPAGVDYLKRTLEFYGFPIGDELLSQEEKEEKIRAQRNNLLAETDYLLMPDYPIFEDKLKQVKQYRQKLRDIPDQPGFPNSVTWPDKVEI